MCRERGAWLGACGVLAVVGLPATLFAAVAAIAGLVTLDLGSLVVAVLVGLPALGVLRIAGRCRKVANTRTELEHAAGVSWT